MGINAGGQWAITDVLHQLEGLCGPSYINDVFWTWQVTRKHWGTIPISIRVSPRCPLRLYINFPHYCENGEKISNTNSIIVSLTLLREILVLFVCFFFCVLNLIWFQVSNQLKIIYPFH